MPYSKGVHNTMLFLLIHVYMGIMVYTSNIQEIENTYFMNAK